MKLLTRINPINLNPKRFFRSNKYRSMVSRSDPSSFSTSSSTSSDHKPDFGDALVNFGTPTRFLPDIYFELAHAFKLIDRDNDGFVSTTKLEKLLTQLGPEPPSQEEVRLVLSELDRDGDINLLFFSWCKIYWVST